MEQRRVAVIQPMVELGGGTEAVASWILEALKDRYKVSLLTYSKNVTGKDLNAYYATNLGEYDFTVVNPAVPPALTRVKQLSMLQNHLLMRYCKHNHGKFDLFISVGAAMDFGLRGIQYFCYVVDPEPAGKSKAWRRLAKRSFHRVCQITSGYSPESMRGNLSLVLSDWSAKNTQEGHNLSSTKVVYPPVNGPAETTPWDRRTDTFLCIARMVPEKGIDYVIKVVDRVRQRGFDISLRIIGRADNPMYLATVQELAKANSSWVHLDGLMTRKELRELMDQSKYGINALFDEPFGIAIAEMVKAGCIVFVPNSGGQTEIVGIPQLIYTNMDEAVGKIIQVLDARELQESMRQHLEQQGQKFSTDAFCRTVREIVDEFFLESQTSSQPKA